MEQAQQAIAQPRAKSRCPECGRASRPAGLDQRCSRCRRKTSNPVFECIFEGCDYKAPTISLLRRHMVNSHPMKSECPVCGKPVKPAGMYSHAFHYGKKHGDEAHIIYFAVALSKWVRNKSRNKQYRELALQKSRIPGFKIKPHSLA